VAVASPSDSPLADPAAAQQRASLLHACSAGAASASPPATASIDAILRFSE